MFEFYIYSNKNLGYTYRESRVSYFNRNGTDYSNATVYHILDEDV